MSVTNTDDKSIGVRKDGTTIEVDLNLCIAAGPCGVVSQNVFLIRDSDGKAIVGDPDGDTMENIISAAKSCPIKAIILKDKTGKQIYP